ncbi:hypothetical protein [Tolypothrix sp. FACHB-123]|nr:hypothetical protein [Tolypothrix sp. FACHB-123]
MTNKKATALSTKVRSRYVSKSITSDLSNLMRWIIYTPHRKPHR